MIILPVQQEEITVVTVLRRKPIVCDETYPILESFHTNYEHTQRSSRRKSLGNGFFISDTSPQAIPEFA